MVTSIPTRVFNPVFINPGFINPGFFNNPDFYLTTRSNTRVGLNPGRRMANPGQTHAFRIKKPTRVTFFGPSWPGAEPYRGRSVLK